MTLNNNEQILANLKLSGEAFSIGVDTSAAPDCTVMIQVSNGELVFMSVPDTELLIAALKLAKFEAQGEKK